MNSLGLHFRRALLVSSRLLCGLMVSVPSAYLYAQPPRLSIVFYADRRVNDKLWPQLFQSMREDLSAGLGALSNGVSLDPQADLLREKDLTAGAQLHHVVEVKLLGRCDVVPQADHHLDPGPLGWVLQISGEIQPFVFVDCTRLAQVLGPTSIRLEKAEREKAMAQAIDRVIIHELVHIATQRTTHSEHGITQARLPVRELVGAAADGSAPMNGR